VEQSTKEVVARVGIHELFVLFVKKLTVLFATQNLKKLAISWKM